MRGFGAFIGRELAEFAGTWKAWVLPTVIVAFGAMSPVLAKVQPQLGMPEATTVDAYLHFGSSMIQVVLMVVVISVAGTVSSERRSGTAILMLTKPLSRTSFVLAKFATRVSVVVASALAGMLLCWAGVQVFFDNVLAAEFATTVGLWVVLATMVIALMTFFSVALDSQTGAAGAGFGLYLVLALLTQWGPARAFSPAGLMTLGPQVLAREVVSVAWPVATALAVAVAAVLAATALFCRQEI